MLLGRHAGVPAAAAAAAAASAAAGVAARREGVGAGICRMAAAMALAVARVLAERRAQSEGTRRFGMPYRPMVLAWGGLWEQGVAPSSGGCGASRRPARRTVGIIMTA